ncbi:hypothetical protein PT974_01056 [Cladobotryum mycophilum]|uniref:Casein kinase substrate phosphoprotein PP28 domain-containing protein n=1 Tax=Cladobotryum mycophilum TaxID=491253 RepID=A0ABR0T367_9HYPO
MPKSKTVVADSWEDEDISDGAPEEPTPEPSKSSSSAAPQTASTTSDAAYSHDWDASSSTLPTSTSSSDPTELRRPEKTDAVARRMIAAGLGLKAPKQTEEQKAYQKAIKEQEKKKKEQEKAEEQRQRELTEKAKASVWED